MGEVLDICASSEEYEKKKSLIGKKVNVECRASLTRNHRNSITFFSRNSFGCIPVSRPWDFSPGKQKWFSPASVFGRCVT